MSNFEDGLVQQHVREAVVLTLKKNQEFIDAAAGLKLLYSWHGDDMINVVATEIEVRRACYSANLECYLIGCERVHSNWEDQNGAFPDGHVLRQLMAASGILGDWFFVPMLRHCATVSFTRYE